MSSIYCDRVYGEHPIGLWSFSDHLTYLTLLSEADEDVSSWSGASSSYAAFVRDRIPTFPGIGGAYKVVDTTSSQVVEGVTEHYIEVSKTGIITVDEANLMDNIDIGFWGFSSGLFNFFEVVLINDAEEIAVSNLSQPLIDQSGYAPSRIEIQTDTWEPVYATFPGPKDVADIQNLGVRIRAYYPTGGTYNFLLGGISVGQGRGSKIILEEGTTSFAPSKESGLQHYGGLNQVVGIPEYGFGRDTAYVLKHENKLLATNTGIPMIYGDTTATTVIASDHPSVVFPGKGFLHEKGRAQELSLEIWLRLDYVDTSSGKIMGPLWSTDGLYMEKGALVLAVGDGLITHNLSGADGPLLVTIVSTPQRITLLVNAEDVGYISPATRYPDSYNFNTDWIGLYATADIAVEFGTVAIYPYAVSPLLAKRRFVWGQGVLTLTKSDFVTFSRTYAKYGMVKKLDFDLIAERDYDVPD